MPGYDSREQDQAVLDGFGADAVDAYRM